MTPAANTNPMQSQALDQLRDIHEAAPISDLPIAPGWWLLLILSLALVIWLVRVILHRRRANKWKAPALAELDTIQQNYFGDGSKESDTIAHNTSQLSALIRRCINTRYQDELSLSQTGNEWKATLLRVIPSLSEQEAQTIALAQYQRQIPKLDKQCFDAIKHWIKARG